MEKKKNSYWGEHLDSIEDCEKLINETHWFLIVMAGLVCLFGFAIKQFFILLPDIVFMIIVALLLKKYQSRSIATIIFIYSVFITMITFGHKLNMPFAKDFGGGTNVFFAMIFVYVAFKTMQATYKLFKLRNLAISWRHFFIKSIIFVVLLLVIEFVALIMGAIVANDILAGLFIFCAMFLAMFVAYAGIFPMSNRLKIKYVKAINQV